MISPVSAYRPYAFSYYSPARLRAAVQGQVAQSNNVPGATQTSQSAQMAQAQATPRAGAALTAQKPAQPGVPVQPVNPTTAIDPGETQPLNLGIPLREGADPVEMAVRMRIQYDTPNPSQTENPADALTKDDGKAVGAESVQQAAEEGRCETCEKRKYQDGSNDMSVSFQTPTHIDPNQAASTVRGHEMEHVSHEQNKAQLNDRKVVSQSVTLHTDICPECGKTYISGGTTRTVTAADNQQQAQQQQQEREERQPFSAVA